MSVTHYLMTRFDYPRGHPDLPRRIEIFRRLTLPAVLSQTSLDFEWIVISKNAEVRDLLDSIPGVTVRKEWTVPPGESEWIVCTRLDNDDFVAPDFMAAIQAAVRPRTEVIDNPSGYRYCAETGRVAYRSNHGPKNPSPFLTLVEKRRDAQGVFCHWHNRMSQYFPVQTLPGRRWVQVIHGKNKLMTWEQRDEQNRIDYPPAWWPRSAQGKFDSMQPPG